MSLPIIFRVEAELEFDEAFDWYEQQQTGLGIHSKRDPQTWHDRV